MKNQDYFEKVIKILKDLNRDYPDVDVSKHYNLATSENNNFLTNKELFLALQKHQNELDINTLSNQDLEKVIEETEELFKEVEEDDADEHDWAENNWNY